MKNEVYVIHLDGKRMSAQIFATYFHAKRIAKRCLDQLACTDLRAKGWTCSYNGLKTINTKAIEKASKKHIGRILIVKYKPSKITYVVTLKEDKLK